MLRKTPLNEPVPDDDDFEPNDGKVTANLEAAIDFGAPRAAAETLKTQLRTTATARPAIGDNPALTQSSAFVRQDFQTIQPTIRKRRKDRALTNIIGHIIASIAGLSLGYYILCWVRPDLNFLQLNLPGTSPTSQDSNK